MERPCGGEPRWGSDRNVGLAGDEPANPNQFPPPHSCCSTAHGRRAFNFERLSQNLVPYPFRRTWNEPPLRLAQPSQKTMAGRVSLAPAARGAKSITTGEPPGVYVRDTRSDSSVLGTQSHTMSPITSPAGIPTQNPPLRTNSSLWSLSGRSVADLSTQKGATWSGASARYLGGLPVSLQDRLAQENCCLATK